MKRIFFVFLFVVLVSGVDASGKINVKLDRCIDGDTARFLVNGESRTVRFLSINAPEIAHDEVLEEFYGKESSDYTCKLLKRASSIKLQYDSKSDKVDKYDRVLAWVFVDDELIQSKLVEGGYAEVKYVYDDYIYSNELKELEKSAKSRKIGMWSDVNLKENYLFNNFSLHDYIVYIFVFLVCLCLLFLKKFFSIKK